MFTCLGPGLEDHCHTLRVFPPQTHLTGLAQMSNGLRERLSSDCSEGVGHAMHGLCGWQVPHSPSAPQLGISREGREGGAEPGHPPPPRKGLSIPLSFYQSEVRSHLLCEKCWA